MQFVDREPIVSIYSALRTKLNCSLHFLQIICNHNTKDVESLPHQKPDFSRLCISGFEILTGINSVTNFPNIVIFNSRALTILSSMLSVYVAYFTLACFQRLSESMALSCRNAILSVISHSFSTKDLGKVVVVLKIKVV